MRMVALGEVAEIERRGVDPSSLPPETLYLGLEHIERGGRIIGHDTVAGAKLASTKFAFTDDHVLFGKLRPYLGKVSTPAFSGVCSTDILPIRPGERLDRGYLAHYLVQPTMVNFAASRATGANLPRLSPMALAQFPVPVPPLAEQRRIAAILDRADGLRTRNTQVLAHLDALEKSLFTSLFECYSFPWEPLGDHIREHQIGLDRRAAEQGPNRANDYVKMDAITRDGKLDLTTLTRVDASDADVTKFSLADGDLLLNTRNSRELVGKTAVYRGRPRLYNNNIMRIRFNGRLLPDYVHRYLWSSSGRRQLEARKSGTTNVFAVYAKSLATLKIPVPPASLQHRFAEEVNRIDVHRAAAQGAVAAHGELFTSLQSRAFRGEV